MSRVGSILDSETARRSVFFDFEASGAGGRTPALLGWLWDPEPDDADGKLLFTQAVVDEEIWSAANRTVPLTGGKSRCRALTLDDALAELAALVVDRDCQLVSWSTFDRDLFLEHCTDTDVAEVLSEQYRDGKKTAKRWLRTCRPEIQLERQGLSGRHRLATYLELFGKKHPNWYAEGVSAEGIRAVREGLGAGGSYANLSSAQREAWKRVLGHNYWDCYGAYYVVAGAAGELEEAS